MRVVLLLFPFYTETNLKVRKVNWYIQSRRVSGIARTGVKCFSLQDSGLTCSASSCLSALTAAPSSPILKSSISRACTSSTQHSFMDEKTEISKAEWWSASQRWGHRQNRGWMPSPSQPGWWPLSHPCFLGCRGCGPLWQSHSSQHETFGKAGISTCWGTWRKEPPV